MHGRRSRTPFQLFLALFFLAAPSAHADVGLLRIQQSSGPYSISAFTEPTPLRESGGTLHVFVSDRDTWRPIRDVQVEVELEPHRDEIRSKKFSLTRRPKGLRASADMAIPHAGVWTVRISAAGSEGVGVVAFAIDALPPQSLWLTLAPALSIPPVGIALFTLHQRLRRRHPKWRSASSDTRTGKSNQ